MLSQRSLKAGLLLAASAYAQSSTAPADPTVVSVFMIQEAGYTDRPLRGSIIDNTDTATTLLLSCDNSGLSDGEVCNFFDNSTVTIGPSTFAGGYAFDGYAMTAGCDITDSATAVCSNTAQVPSLPVESWPTTMTRPDPAILGTVFSTTRDTLTGISYAPLTITAGKLKASGEAGSGSGGEGQGPASGTAAETGSSSASGAGAAATSASKAGRVQLTVSAAAAALLAGIVMAL